MGWYQQHNYGSNKRGEDEIEKESDRLFNLAATARNWELTPADYTQNVYEHWDWKLDKPSATHLVDIKGLKRIDSWKDPDDSMLLVEYSNVGGNRGWARGDADYIAFLVKEGFAFVKTPLLLTYSMQVIDWSGEVLPSARNKKVHTVYQRSQWGKKDLFAYLTKEEIMSLKTVFWRI